MSQHTYTEAPGYTHQEMSEINSSQTDFSYLALVEIGVLAAIYCFALTVLGIWRSVCYCGRVGWRGVQSHI